MHILIAPDKFKGSLGAREVAENIAKGLRDGLGDAKIDIVPMADGGEGTADVICRALGGSWLGCKAHDPLGREIECRYAYIDKNKLALIEMSEAAGMRRLRPNERDVDLASTFGVGEMIVDAAQRGPREIIIGLGGSATNDSGFGMVRALGFRFLGDSYEELTGNVSELSKLTRIQKPKDLLLPKIIAAVDVRNPLLGENGATRVFGPQKGANEDKIDKLERALTRLADVVTKQFGSDFRDEPGAGAAGGLGFGLMSFCGAKIRSGFDVVAEAVSLESKMEDVDVVITGEGSLDRQTLAGKTPAGVARLARKLRKRVYAIVGRASEDRQVREIFDGVFENARRGMSEKENMAHAAELLRENARELGEMLKKTLNTQRPTSNGRRGKEATKNWSKSKGRELGSR
jgi:glycerate kinase